MLKELLFESNREYYYARLYIDEKLFRKQRRSSAFLWAGLGFIIALVQMAVNGVNFLSILFSIFLVLALGYGGYKSKYKDMLDLAKRQDSKVGMAFPEFLDVFIGMLEVNPSGGLLNALKMTIPYVQNPVKARVIRLTYAIDVDGSTQNVRQALQEFGQYVGSTDAIRILDIMYTMYVDGVDNRALDMASEKIEKLMENTVNTYVEKKKRALYSRSMPAMILGVAFLLVFVGVVGYQYLSGAMVF